MRISEFITNVFLAFILFVPFSLFGQVTFESHDQYIIGPTTYALKAGDFNNDGWMDMVAGNFTGPPKHVSVLMNNKLGGFSISNITAAGSYADLEIADFNKDGNLDFVAGSSSDQITIFIGNGDGTFSFTNIPAGDGPRDVLTGDFNEDTNPDIAVLHQSSDDIYIFYGDGLGGVGAPQIIAMDAQGSRMAVGDFNGNTHLDLIVGANTLLYFYAGDGAGGFAAPLPTGGSFSGFDYLEAADFDMDGDLDLVGAGSTFGFTSTGAGDGTFGPRTFVPEGGLISITGDFDTDGNLDIVTTKGNKIIYYPGDGTGDYYTSPYHRMMLEGGGRGLVAADWNNDGNLDLALTTNISSIAGYVQVTYGKGNGYFNSEFEYPTPNNPRGLTTEDFNEDGLEDLALVADGKLVIFLGESNGTFTKISTQNGGAFLYDIEAIHINADNHVDLALLDVTANAVILFSGDGTGIFTAAGSVTVTADFELFVKDVNNDNIDDLILGGGQAKNVQIFKGNGDETFSFLFEADMGEIVKSVYADFINIDINPDIAVLVNPATGPAKIKFFQGDGIGGFTPVASELTLTTGGSTFTKGDFNNDGIVDFLSLGSDGDIFVGNGDFTFNYSSTSTGVSLVEHSTEVSDIDGDGFGDLISGSDCSVCSSGGRIQVNRGFGDGTFSTAFWSKSQVGGYRMVVSDFNNDGKNDIASLVNNSGFDGVSILLNTSGPPPCDAADVTVNPVSATLCEGGVNHVLFVNATGTSPLTYQWQKDGINIPGSLNSPSYTLSNYTQTDAGTYRCIVTNTCGNDTSAGATIVINESPPIPTTADVGACGVTTVTLVASGTTDGNYRWYDVAVGGVALVGEVNGSFTTPLLSATKIYYVSISNGTCESSRVEITAIITNPIAITVQPVSKSASVGDNVTLSTTVAGDNPQYQWQKDGVDLVGKTTASLTVTNVTEADAGSYSCNILNGCNSVTTSPAVLSIVVTGLSQFEVHSILIYPNPSTGILSIQNNQSGELRLILHSLHGKELYSGSINSSTASIDLSHLSKGLYVLTLSNGKALMRKKIVIDR